jgi:hypothetical protein
MDDFPMPEAYNFDAAIVHNNRVCEIDLTHLTSSQLQRLALAMQEQFPALIHLTLFAHLIDGPSPALLDGLLGGSAPNLQSLKLQSIPFPALPKLLLSATDLVRLSLWDIPQSGYFSPEAIVTSLAVLVNLKYLTITYECYLGFYPNPRHLPEPARAVLPSLTHFEFRGISEYLEDLVARVRAPLLDSIRISILQASFEIPRLAQFMKRMTMVEELNEAHVYASITGVEIESHPLPWTFDEKSRFKISCEEWDGEWADNMEQIFTSFYHSIHMVEHLYIHGCRSLPFEKGYDNTPWLQMFRPFATLKNLYIIREFVEAFARPLRELVELGATDMLLPALECLFLEDVQPSGPMDVIGDFVAARQLAGHPITVSLWERDPEWD